jgi:hypothetical protein
LSDMGMAMRSSCVHDEWLQIHGNKLLHED